MFALSRTDEDPRAIHLPDTAGAILECLGLPVRSSSTVPVRRRLPRRVTERGLTLLSATHVGACLKGDESYHGSRWARRPASPTNRNLALSTNLRK